MDNVRLASLLNGLAMGELNGQAIAEMLNENQPRQPEQTSDKKSIFAKIRDGGDAGQSTG